MSDQQVGNLQTAQEWLIGSAGRVETGTRRGREDSVAGAPWLRADRAG